MTWADLKDRKCVMEIINTELAEGETVVLTPSGTPFITTMDGDTNPMTPVRAQSGKIGFIATDGFRILPRNSHQWRIVMRRGGRTMWTGWLKAETYNQRLWGVNEEVTLNVIDDVEALKTWTLDAAEGFGMVTLRSLMTECLAHIHNVTGGDALELEWSMDVSPTSGPFYELFELQVSRYNFFSRVADSEAHEGQTCYEVMESICKAFGWTMSLQPATYGPEGVHEGMKMLFSYAGAFNYMKDTFENFRAERWNGGTDSAPLVRAIEDYQPCSLHDYSIEPGYRKVSVVSKINKASNTLPSLQFDDADIKWVEEFEVEYFRGKQNTSDSGSVYTMPWRVRLLEPRNPLLKLPKYTFENGVMAKYDGEVTKNNFDGKSLRGIYAISHDYWSGPKEDQGSSETEEGKINYDWQTLLLVRCASIAENTYPLLVAKSADSCLFQNGGFEIGMNLHVQDAKSSLDIDPGITIIPTPESQVYGPIKAGWQIRDGGTNNPRVVCLLRVGDRWWNGTQWDGTRSTFSVTIWGQQAFSYNHEKSNKTLDMPFNSTKYAIPINTSLAGDLEFQVIKVDYGRGYVHNFCLMQGLTFNYCEPESERTLDDLPDSHEYTHTEEGWTETLGAVTLDIHSDKDDAANYGVLTYAGGTPVKNIYNALTGETERPEEALLEKYKAHFTRSREILTLRYFLQDWMEPRNEASIGREVYSLLAVQSVNWLTSEAELVMEHLGAMGSRPEAPERPELPENNMLGYTLAFPLGG